MGKGEGVLGAGGPQHIVRHQHLSFGAECTVHGVRFALWAPRAQSVHLVLASSPEKPEVMQRQDGGWFELTTPSAHAGSLYRYLIDNDALVPDPAARFQPQDVHGPSEVIDPNAFLWTDKDWRGRAWEEAVFYELHVGTFSPQGTYAGAAALLPHLVALGITAVELMPLADFPGRRNWGYDGVLLFAPDSSYGRPDDLKAFIQTAHHLGLMVFLDVVYNHFGPDGNYLARYAPQFFTARHKTPWGDAVNYDGPGSSEVRSFFLENVRYWLTEYNFDGLRLDAVHAILDDSRPDIITAINETVFELRRSGRHIHVVLENENNTAAYLSPKPEAEARLASAQWNDDVHHVLHRLLTDETDGYYIDYRDNVTGLLGRCLTEGFAYQGDFSSCRQGLRGQISKHLPLTAFVSFLQNHDQIGNRALGERITSLTPEQPVRAAMAILLLAPSPPMLFMGQEFGCSQPFLFFCDFNPELAAAVTEGRRREFARFPAFRDPEARARIPDPGADTTYEASRLDWNDAHKPEGRRWLTFYHDILLLRRDYVVPRLKLGAVRGFGYQLLSGQGLRATWNFADGQSLVLDANLSDSTLHYDGALDEPFYQDPPPFAGPAAEMAAWSVRWFLIGSSHQA